MIVKETRYRQYRNKWMLHASMTFTGRLPSLKGWSGVDGDSLDRQSLFLLATLLATLLVVQTGMGRLRLSLANE